MQTTINMNNMHELYDTTSHQYYTPPNANSDFTLLYSDNNNNQMNAMDCWQMGVCAHNIRNTYNITVCQWLKNRLVDTTRRAHTTC